MSLTLFIVLFTALYASSLRVWSFGTWTTPDGVYHAGYPVTFSPDPAPSSGNGYVAFPPGGPEVNPSSALDTRYLSFIKTKTTWADYGFPNARTMPQDLDTVACQCVFHPSEPLHWETYVGPAWGLRNNTYSPLVPPTAPAKVQLMSQWIDNCGFVGEMDAGSIISMRQDVYLVGVDHVEVKLPDANGTMQWQALGDGATLDVVTGGTYLFKTVFDPEDAQIPSDLYPWWQWYCWDAGVFGDTGTFGATDDPKILSHRFDYEGVYTMWVSCGSTNQQITVRALAPRLVYKRSSEPDPSYFKSDGGGVNGEVLLDASFTYRAGFDAIYLSQPRFAGYAPHGFRFRFEHVNYIFANDPLATVLGDSVDYTVSMPGNTRVTCEFSDKNGYHYAASKDFRARPQLYRKFNVRYAAGLSSTVDPDAINAQVQSALSGATGMYLKREDPQDYRCLVDFSVGSFSSYTNSWTNSWTTPEEVVTSGDCNLLFGAPCFIADIVLPSRVVPFTGGLTWNVPVSRTIIAPDSWGNSQVYANELGHYCGLLADYGAYNCDCGQILWTCYKIPGQPTDFQRGLIMYHTSNAPYPCLPPESYLLSDQAAACE